MSRLRAWGNRGAAGDVKRKAKWHWEKKTSFQRKKIQDHDKIAGDGKKGVSSLGKRAPCHYGVVKVTPLSKP